MITPKIPILALIKTVKIQAKDSHFDNNDKGITELNNNPVQKLIDEGQILSNFNIDGNTDNKFITEVLNVYVNELPFISKELEIAYQKRDSSLITYYTHKLSGSLLNLGCNNLVDLCQRIEKSIKKNSIDENVSLPIRELTESIKKLVTELNELMEKYPDSGDNH